MAPPEDSAVGRATERRTPSFPGYEFLEKSSFYHTLWLDPLPYFYFTQQRMGKMWHLSLFLPAKNVSYQRQVTFILKQVSLIFLYFWGVFPCSILQSVVWHWAKWLLLRCNSCWMRGWAWVSQRCISRMPSYQSILSCLGPLLISFPSCTMRAKSWQYCSTCVSTDFIRVSWNYLISVFFINTIIRHSSLRTSSPDGMFYSYEKSQQTTLNVANPACHRAAIWL